MTVVHLRIRKDSPPEAVDLDTLTPKARALAEAIAMSTEQRPLAVLCDTGRTKGDNPNHALLHGTGPAADEIGARPDLRFVEGWKPIPRDSTSTAVEWLERNARSIPHTAWPIAGARSRMEPLTERVPSADAAREDRCVTRDGALDYLRDHGVTISLGAWIPLQKAGNLPAPRRFALGGRMPLWHVDDLDAYATRVFERWTTSRVADYLGYQGDAAVGTARRQLTRWELLPVDREPGRAGENRYPADQVIAMQQARPGRGRWAESRPQ